MAYLISNLLLSLAVIVGGFAVISFGYIRETRDIDLLGVKTSIKL